MNEAGILGGLRANRADAALLRPEPLARADLQASQGAFAQMLGRAQTGGSREEQARSAAEQFVAQTFVQPILKQVRESDRTPAPFAPSQGEKQFRALMDAELAQRIVSAKHFPLVDHLARDLLRKGGGAAPPAR